MNIFTGAQQNDYIRFNMVEKWSDKEIKKFLVFQT